LDKRAQVSLNLSGNAKNSNLTRSGNSNDVGVFVVGHGDNIVNITIGLEADNSVLEDSNNKNTIKVYIWERNDFVLRNSTVRVVGENNTATVGSS
jgi:hypothetical protein